MKKRIVSLLLVFCMVITLVPANVLADEVKGLAETTAGQTQTAGTTAAKPENPFADVKSGSWYEAAVLYARANGFFDGTSATTFEPDGPMTRAMFVTVLGRMAGVEAADYAGATDFIDVAEGTWYAPFVKWAARYGITTGTGNGKFSPDGRITREEMAVFFVRYFETFDAMPKADTTVTTKPADLDEVSSWAQESVLKLWALGLLNGDGKSFDPKAKATRAQTAALCQRTDKAVETWYSEPGVKSERVSVEPGSGQESGDKKPEEQKPSGGGSSGGGSSNNSKPQTVGGTAVDRAYGELGKPYSWGAVGPDSYDCSGLVSYCLLGRHSRLGTAASFMGYTRVSNPKPGDICCNDHHCGIYIGDGQMIHAPRTGDVVKISAVHSGMIYTRY